MMWERAQARFLLRWRFCLEGAGLCHREKGRCPCSSEGEQAKFARQSEIVPGTAPEAMVELPVPTHAFIGGSSGNMNEIIRLLLDKKSGSTDRDQLHHPGDGDGSHECHTRFQPDGCGYRTAVCGKIQIYRKVSYDDGREPDLYYFLQRKRGGDLGEDPENASCSRSQRKRKNFDHLRAASGAGEPWP